MSLDSVFTVVAVKTPFVFRLSFLDNTGLVCEELCLPWLCAHLSALI